MILVDSNIWIKFWSTTGHPTNKKLKQLIDEDRAAINGLILTEVCQGARTEKELHTIESYLELVTFLPFTEEHWSRSAKLFFDLRRKGVTTTTIDCLIAAHAITQNILLFSGDGIFHKIAAKTALKIYE